MRPIFLTARNSTDAPEVRPYLFWVREADRAESCFLSQTDQKSEVMRKVPHRQDVRATMIPRTIPIQRYGT
jgi:hypothetical protein